MAVTDQQPATPSPIAAAIPRVRLAVLPTPLVAAPTLAASLGIAGPLLIKRDDLTGFAVAGNKARQLEFLLADAIASRADVLVTGGNPSSNFVQAAAAAAMRAGLACELAIPGSPLPPPWPPNLAAAIAWGARVRWTEDPDRGSVDAMLETLARELAERGSRPYVMPRGGASAVGCEGYRHAVDELVEQLEEKAETADDAALRAGKPMTIVVAVGSGGTMSGLLAGVVAHGRRFRLVGASVSRPPDNVRAGVLRLASEVAKRHGDELPTADDVRIVDARGPGHGKPSEAGDAAAHAALREAGVVLDPVYTAKALAVVPAVAREGAVLFWHTGGLLDAVADWTTRGRRSTP